MTPPTLSVPSANPAIIPLEPLTPESFAPFGTVITSPLQRNLNAVPESIPPPRYLKQQTSPVFANQNSALKTSPISPLVNNYPNDNDSAKSRPQMSMFSCFPRTNLKKSQFPVLILERHPYTTQTFSPLGLSPTDKSTCFLIIVAPTLAGSLEATSSTKESVSITRPPDLSRIKAFLAKGDQAVTYGPGTWHAPMVVLGAARVDFVVTQFVNGVADDDCQELLIGGDVAVDLSGLKLEGLSTIGPKL